MLMTQGCNGVSRETLHARGINVGLIRLSIGVEDAEDLIEDLTNALEQIPETLENDLNVQSEQKVDNEENEDKNQKADVMEMFKRTLSRTKLTSSNLNNSNSNQFSPSKDPDLVYDAKCHSISVSHSINNSNKMLST